jgi:hypothetical protein
MTFGISEVARILNVGRDLVKTWVYHFSEYLSAGATPPKGTPRQFLTEDIRVLAFVSMYWEDDPDTECIKMGLNAEDHLEEPYNNLMTEINPIFQELPDDLDETWRHGAVISGMAGTGDDFSLAESYKLAGDVLVDAALSRDEAHELAFPIIYNYRHAVELYLKSVVEPKDRDHILAPLLEGFRHLLTTELKTQVPDWFERLVLQLHTYDPTSTSFRYGGSEALTSYTELWVDLPHTKKLMGWLAEGFQRVRLRLWER